MFLSLGANAAEPVATRVSLEPVYNALTSLWALTAGPIDGELDGWVRETAARLTPEQQHRNRLVFEGLGAALTVAEIQADFPAYLDALAAEPPTALRDRVLQPLCSVPGSGSCSPEQLLTSAETFLEQTGSCYPDALVDRTLLVEVHALLGDPPALQHLVVAHLREMWQNVLSAEWTRRARELAGLVAWLQQRELPPASAAETIRMFSGRELPDSLLVQLAGVREVVFVLSPHVGFHAFRFSSPTTIWVFVLGRFQDLRVRQGPIMRGEVLPPLSALADDTRLRILELLAQHKDLTAQAIIAHVEQSQPNVSRHLKGLVAAGFVREQRAEGGIKQYQLNPRRLDELFRTLKVLLSAENARARDVDDARITQPVTLRRFLDAQGRLTKWPARGQDQRVVLAYMASKFVAEREYSEREVNDLLNRWHSYGDPATLRRTLFDAQVLDRTNDGARYWLR